MSELSGIELIENACRNMANFTRLYSLIFRSNPLLGMVKEQLDAGLKKLEEEAFIEEVEGENE